MPSLQELDDSLNANGKPSHIWGYRSISTVLKMVTHCKRVEARCSASLTNMIDPVYGKITKRQARDALRSFDNPVEQYLCQLTDSGTLILGGSAVASDD